MANLTEHFREHHVWQNLENLGPTIDAVAASEGLDADSLDSIGACESPWKADEAPPSAANDSGDQPSMFLNRCS